jgi:hypothetical protein
MTTPEAGHRLRHFVLQLLPVTGGILIALLVYGLVELQRGRSLAREARAAIAAEVVANTSDLNAKLPELKILQDDLAKVAQVVNDILNRGRTDIEDFGYALPRANLDRASWESAERTGALTYMEYADVRKYSGLYALQDLVEDRQRDLLTRLPALGIIAQAMASGDPEGYVQDLQDRRADVAAIQAALDGYIDLANALSMEYAAF